MLTYSSRARTVACCLRTWQTCRQYVERPGFLPITLEDPWPALPAGITQQLSLQQLSTPNRWIPVIVPLCPSPGVLFLLGPYYKRVTAAQGVPDISWDLLPLRSS